MNQMYRWLPFLGWLYISLTACFSSLPKQEKPSKRFDIQEQTSQIQIIDLRSRLHFSLLNSRLKGRYRLPEHDFELIFENQELPCKIFFRKDQLPSLLPQGALSSDWLQRYVESYAEKQGYKKSSDGSKVLDQDKTTSHRFSSSVWLSFPIQQQQWEALVFSKSNRYRYLFVFQYPQAAMQKTPWKYELFFKHFKEHLAFPKRTNAFQPNR